MKNVLRAAVAAATLASTALAAWGFGEPPGGDFDGAAGGLRGVLKQVGESCMMRGLAGGEADLGAIVNAGRRTWKIIEDGRVLPNQGRRFAAALPEGLGDWRRLCQWSEPETDSFSIDARDVLGGTAARATYAVVRTTGGRYAGKGRFIADVEVVPTSVEVRPGWNLSMQAEVIAVNNIGTAGEPIAAMALAVKWRAKGPVREERGVSVYYITGDGKFQRMVKSP